MKKYYLHINNETFGPFDLEELKARNVTEKTPVWFVGMEHWKTAVEIPELNSLFTVIPPPISYFSTTPITAKVEQKKEEWNLWGISRTTVLIVAGIVSLTAATIVFKSVQENRSRELKLKNHQTDIENHQYQLREKEFEEQKALVAVEEKAAAERMIRNRQQTASRRVSEIQQTMADYQYKLEATEKKLIETENFRLLRNESEKERQLNVLHNNINFYRNAILKLRDESDQLKLELEKYPK
jgi:GYF domain 2